MKKSALIWVVVLVAIVAGAGVYLATRNKNSDKHPSTNASSSSSTSTTQPAATQTSSVTIQNMAFSPADITVTKGTTVTWTNQDSVAHSVVGNGTGLPSDFGSPVLQNGDKYSYTFASAGTYKYKCGIHSSMQGTVSVTE